MKRIQIGLALILMTFAASSYAALNAYAALTLNGTALDGDVTMRTIGGIDVSSDHIEIYKIDHTMLAGKKKRGVAESSEIVLMKRIDQTTPQFIDGLVNNLSLDGDIRMFDNDPDSGETRHRFTIRLTGARIVGVNPRLPDAYDADESNRPPYEIVRIEVKAYEFVDEINATSVMVNF